MYIRGLLIVYTARAFSLHIHLHLVHTQSLCMCVHVCVMLCYMPEGRTGVLIYARTTHEWANMLLSLVAGVYRTEATQLNCTSWQGFSANAEKKKILKAMHLHNIDYFKFKMTNGCCIYMVVRQITAFKHKQKNIKVLRLELILLSCFEAISNKCSTP